MVNFIRHKLILLSLILCVVVANGQITFNKIDSLSFVNSLSTSLIETDSGYYVTGVYSDDVDSSYIQGSYLNQISFEGEIIEVNLMVDSTNNKTFEQYRSNLRNSQDGNFFQSGYQWENSEIDPYVIKFDENGNILFQTLLRSKFEKGNGFELDADCLELPNGEIITITICQRDDQGNDAASEICIYKLSATGDLLWGKVIEDPARRDFTGQLAFMPSGNIMLFGGKSLGHLDRQPLSWATLTEIDTAGNLVSRWESVTEDSLQRISTGLVIEDGFLIGTGKRIEIFKDLQLINDPALIKLNEDYEEEWRLLLFNRTDSLFSDVYTYNKMIDLKENDTYVVCGRGHFGDIDNVNGDLSDEFGRVLKFNGDGEIIWERNYQFFGDEVYFDHHLFNDIIQTSDDGFLACGLADNPNAPGGINSQFSWLVKMDEYGCVVPGCHDLIDNTFSAAKTAALKLFPNPVSDILNVAVNHEGSLKNAELILSNNLGQRLKAYPIQLRNLTMMIDVSGLESGMYYLSYVVDGVVLRTEGFVKGE